MRVKGLDVDIRREGRKRLSPVPAREGARLRRDRPYTVGAPEGERSEAVAEWAQQPAHRRPVEPRRLAPVPLNVDHDLYGHARETSCQQEGRRLVDALHERDIRFEVAELARDAPRQHA